MPNIPTIRLLLVDDHPVLRAGLANVLNFDAGLRVVAEADDGEAADAETYRRIIKRGDDCFAFRADEAWKRGEIANSRVVPPR